MAELQPDDYKKIRKSCYRKGAGKEELQLLTTIPPKSVLLSIFQAAEDRTVAAFALFRSDMETALGIPANAASLALARKLYAGYIAWKLENI